MSTKEWHLRKEVTIGNIIASVLALGAVIGAFYNLDIRIHTNTNDITTNRSAIEEEKTDRKEDMALIRKKLDKIETLLIQGLREGARK